MDEMTPREIEEEEEGDFGYEVEQEIGLGNYEERSDDMEVWYTLTVDGSPIDGSTDDKAEAQGNLRRAIKAGHFDAEDLAIVESDRPLAW
jgi:hypothetical protein